MVHEKSWGDRSQLPEELVCLGFDYGRRSMGVAVGQSVTGTASPLKIVKMNRYKPDWQAVQVLLTAWQPAVCVIGLPLKIDGGPQKISRHAEHFAGQLAKIFAGYIVMVDERYTTLAAREKVFLEHGFRGLDKEKIDCYAAKIIVEHWLQSQDRL